MSEIFYEITGERRQRKPILTYLCHLKGLERELRPKNSARKALDSDLCETKGKIEKIQEDCKALLRLPMATCGDGGPLLQSIQNTASQLHAAVQADQRFRSLMSKPNPALNGDVNIFREFYHIVDEYPKEFEIYPAASVPTYFFSPLYVSSFYRIDVLPSLARSIVYDFGHDPNVMHDFSKLLSPGSQHYLKHVRIDMIEGFMLPNETQPFSSERSLSTHINTTLPNLRTLSIDLWPRDPSRIDKDNRAWGEQSEALLQDLSNVKAKVRLGLRWVEDCERFEREYVTNGAWERVLEVELDDKNYGGSCCRFYELQGGGEKVAWHSSEGFEKAMLRPGNC
ncbi:hypothetical protein IMSHALPRED_001114 [Imshaugia aleurites]|uniref:Uncharacterized protein n=1 Tax=Imshaugia aleurites TaxID=172621 RepID=A0A8H3PEG8_9LECA|nr:hypothetical protein IMSHALPRED_001114 [Imshaugia aleurites]